MCGIAGFISARQLSLGDLVNMTDIIRHRGPDDEGYVCFELSGSEPTVFGGEDTPHLTYSSELPFAPRKSARGYTQLQFDVAIAHRRLSIVDLSPSGHQPMCTPDRRCWIVYNGEVYNYLELRQELEGLGHFFFSFSDTEVILAAYRQWGVDCLQRFNGMWAFALYDADQKTMFLARDRFGVKPLYYWLAPDGSFYFASEIKQFTSQRTWKARLNHQRAYDYLAWGITDHTDETLFQGVFQLRPGHYMSLCAKTSDNAALRSIVPVKWYELNVIPYKADFNSAAEEFRHLLSDAVKLRLRADVPIGSCLSGGLDSSSIVCIINQQLRGESAFGRQKTFSACSDYKEFDESIWINEVVSATNVEAHYVTPQLDGLFEDLGSITWHQDEPFGSTSIYAQWNVFRLAAEDGVKVMLDGQGADEQLAGYHGFFGPRFAGLLRAGHFKRLIKEISSTKRLHGYSETKAFMYLANVMLPQVIRQPLRAMVGKDHVSPGWINFKALQARQLDPLLPLGCYTDNIRSLSIAQLTSTNLQMLLHWEDRNSMAHSLEARVPFLDYRIVEFVLGLPDEYKLSDGVTKRVLRAGMKGILPDRICHRMDKVGFVTAEEMWLKKTATERFRSSIMTAMDTSMGIFHERESLSVLGEIVSGNRPYNYIPWRIISFGEWFRVMELVM